MTRTAYDVLGVAPDATPAEIRRAYRQRAKTAHPDLHPDAEAAHTRWIEIQLAYELLCDPERRAAHDRGDEDFDNPSREWLERRLAQLVRRRQRLRRLYED